MAFEQTNADLQTLTTLAQAAVSTCQSAQAEAKTASDALAAGDTNISGQLQNIIAILQPFAPPAPAEVLTPPAA